MKKIQRIIRDVQQHWVGDGFPVRSLFSYGGGNDFDPFLLLDYAGPHEFAAGEAKRGVSEHPHRGFETVTILYQGELEHRDSSGSHGTLGPGDVQWMTAASGIVHEEFHSRQFAESGGTLEMVQLWVNLRSGDKASPPKYQDLRDSEFPRVELPGGAGTARVIAGQFGDTRGVASTFSPINVWDLQLNAGASCTVNVPVGHTTVLIAQAGRVSVNETAMNAVELALFERDGDAIAIESQTISRLLILTGEPLGEPVVGQGPFVMNSREEIHAAIRDYQSGKMGHLS
ncbi:pirin family protein [Allorhodopirellula heiligendammensis]|uniref:Quercetin 2,3-dioxygenase n=1 Tax=Allorhodopirellula heiligendammensis TaxID=2714739 RepID=A0A5C6BDI5_9BACT|nr:pirin family protein [Allorhodopirellula heiligendammensis]TWU10128.1 Quercetin 2,3-dioxygenase [Allorhodopirellula heiligendammensis]